MNAAFQLPLAQHAHTWARDRLSLAHRARIKLIAELRQAMREAPRFQFLPYVEPTDRKAWTAQPIQHHGKVAAHWIVQRFALQWFAAGRVGYPLAARSKKYQPVPIVWGELPPDLRQAFERIAEALTWRRTLGEDGVERLVRLNQLYKRWTQGRASASRVIADADGFVAFAEAAPRPGVYEPQPSTTDEKLDAEGLITAVRAKVARAPAHVRKRLEDEAITESLIGKFDPTESIETRAKRAIWRVEARVRREIRRTPEKSCRRNGRFDSEPF